MKEEEFRKSCEQLVDIEEELKKVKYELEVLTQNHDRLVKHKKDLCDILFTCVGANIRERSHYINGKTVFVEYGEPTKVKIIDTLAENA